MRHGDSNQLSDIPARDEMGHIVGSFNAIASELMQVSSHMSAVVDHAADGIITMDQQGVIQSFNPAAEQIFGYHRDEVIGRNITMLIPEQTRQRHLDGLRHYRETGEAHILGKAIDVQGLKENGDKFPMALSVNTMDIDGRPMFIGMVRDSSEHQALENQLRHAQKMEAVGALVGGVAHNFNNLLAGIIGKTYMAKRNMQDRPEALAYLESIEAISSQAGDMIRQLLTFAHKDFFRDQQDTPLDILISEAFKTARLSIAEDISLDLQIMDTNIMVCCDASQVQQVLMNMMNNARDALEGCADKHIHIKLDTCTPDAAFFQRHEALAEGDYACLSISDSGCGMDAETVDKIFDPFYTTKDVGKGTGLGLSTAFGTIAAHHGVIEVDSSPGKGTCFRIYLPLIEYAENGVNQQQAPQTVHSRKGETLLLVDDEPLLRHTIKEVLVDLGYHVITAGNGQQGVEQFLKHQHCIDALITDVVMPEMSGLEMFRQIRALNRHVPTIFMTGYDQDAIDITNDEQANTLILSKPVQMSTLSQHIESMLKH
ncbi:MAG: PAS domain S-box protein, partial [Mariprofundaceae bacterium]